jgi:hypothetical protein
MICVITVRADGQMQVTLFGLAGRVVLEQRYLPLLGDIVNGQKTGIVLLSLIAIAGAVTRTVIARIIVGAGNVAQYAQCGIVTIRRLIIRAGHGITHRLAGYIFHYQPGLE